MCVCKDPSYFKQNINGGTSCQPCPKDSRPAANLLSCICNNPQYHFDNDNSVAECKPCPKHSVWNAQDKTCDCQSGSELSPDKTFCKCKSQDGKNLLWYNGKCQTCPQFSIDKDGECLCESGFKMTKDGCTKETDQDPHLLAIKYVSEPMGDKTICYGFHRASAYTFIGQDVDFSQCPKNSRKAIFLEGYKLQNNLFSGTVYLNPNDEFIGVIAEYMPEMYVVDMELHLSLFSDNMKHISFFAPAAGKVEIHRSNISYVYENVSSETYGCSRPSILSFCRASLCTGSLTTSAIKYLGTLRTPHRAQA